MLLARLANWLTNQDRVTGIPGPLVMDYGRRSVTSFVLALGLGLVVAGYTAATAYLFGKVINQAYVDRNFPAVATLAIVVIALFATKGVSLKASLPGYEIVEQSAGYVHWVVR
jgi:hypothetical protein